MYEPEMKKGNSIQPGAPARPAPAGPRTNTSSGSVRGGQRVPGSANAAPNFNRDIGTARQPTARPGINRPASQMLAEGRSVGATSDPVPAGADFHDQPGTEARPNIHEGRIGQYRADAQKHEQMMQQRDQQAAAAPGAQQQQLAGALGALFAQLGVQAPGTPAGSNPLGTGPGTNPAAAAPPGTSPQQPVAEVAPQTAEEVAAGIGPEVAPTPVTPPEELDPDTGQVTDLGGQVTDLGGQVTDLSGRRAAREADEVAAAAEAKKKGLPGVSSHAGYVASSGGGGTDGLAAAGSNPYLSPLQTNSAMDLGQANPYYNSGNTLYDQLFGYA